MTITISDLAKKFGLKPGHVFGILSDLGIDHDMVTFETDNDTLDFINDALEGMKNSKEMVLQPNRSPRDIALALDVPVTEIQKALMMKLRVMATLTTHLKADVAEKLLDSFGYKLKWVDVSAPKAVTPKAKKKATDTAVVRPPVVTIMGHVDHGKTSLLDYIRKSNVVSTESGGITQHIGAYQVVLPEGQITFLDTPGHAAFTAMRARGAMVTDIAILVVAADDGIMPQTIEAINHAKNAKVPVIVALNKIDKPGANPDRVMTMLPEHGLIPEAYGGDTIVCPVSAATGEGIPHLLEMIILQAEVLQLTGNPKGKLEGSVVEAKLDKGRGPVATLLVQEGTLHIGDSIVVGQSFGKVKAMMNYLGEKITEAGPSVPVEVLGLSEVPEAGDRLEYATDEKTARNLGESRADSNRRKNLPGQKKQGRTLQDLRRMLEDDQTRDLNLVVKADVQGSVEAVRGMLEKLENEEITVKVIHSGVGTINENDILLASTSGAICVGFNVKPEAGAKREAERHKVEIRTYTIIYELIEDIEAAIKGMLEPKFQEEYLGTVEVRMVFNLSKYGKVAGCHVTDGKVTRSAQVRVTRGTEVVYEGKVSSLKHVKEDVREAAVGFDCGIQFDDWTLFEAGDVIEAYEMVQM